MLIIELRHPRARDLIGFIPSFLNPTDPRPAKEQLHTNYAHGGGWNPLAGFTYDPKKLTLKYSGDPEYKAVARILFRDELIVIFPDAWVVVEGRDGTWEAARMD